VWRRFATFRKRAAVYFCSIPALNIPNHCPEALPVIREQQKNVQTQLLSTSSEGPSSPWQVLHVRSNFERRVAQHLSVRSIQHYVPLYRERVKWTDRTVVTERPLFPGYVFARYSSQTKLAVITTPGIVRLLGDEEGDLVSSDELQKIRDGLADGLLLRPHPNVSVGTKVKIRQGLFMGFEGVVTEFRQQCKVVIALAAVRQCFSLELDALDVEVLKKPVVTVGPTPTYGTWSPQLATQDFAS
jgi:transcription antitermination factor NusG